MLLFDLFLGLNLIGQSLDAQDHWCRITAFFEERFRGRIQQITDHPCFVLSLKSLVNELLSELYTVLFISDFTTVRTCSKSDLNFNQRSSDGSWLEVFETGKKQSSESPYITRNPMKSDWILIFCFMFIIVHHILFSSYSSCAFLMSLPWSRSEIFCEKAPIRDGLGAGGQRPKEKRGFFDFATRKTTVKGVLERGS